MNLYFPNKFLQYTQKISKKGRTFLEIKEVERKIRRTNKVGGKKYNTRQYGPLGTDKRVKF